MSPREDTSPTPALSAGRPSRPLSLLGLSFAVILLTVIGGAAFAGYRAGLAQRESQMRATQTLELKTQYDLGVSDLAAGRSEIAATRFEYILRIDPAYPGAVEKLAEARAALQATATPAPDPSPTPVADDAAEIFALAQQYYAAGDWNGVITQLAILHSIDPNYEAVRADGMLFVALRHRGVARIQGDEMEAGIFDLDQAQAFGPLDSEAVNYRAWARLYLAAQSYWGVNWQQAAQILQQLYILAPNFRDTSSRLYQATLNYAGQLAAAGDQCGAAEQYAAAQNLFVDPNVAEAEATAQEACLLTPTPEDTPEPGDVPEGDATPTPGP
jgi:tetratricopeptide (TPR) repeat protein